MGIMEPSSLPHRPQVSKCETGNAAETSRVAMVAEQALPDLTWHL